MPSSTACFPYCLEPVASLAIPCPLPLAGFPSVGKSSLLNELTGTESEAAAYEFTTLTCIPGVIHYNDAKIQLLDLPGIIEGAAQGKGRGRQVRHVCLAPECHWLLESGLAVAQPPLSYDNDASWLGGCECACGLLLADYVVLGAWRWVQLAVVLLILLLSRCQQRALLCCVTVPGHCCVQVS
jgi:hypothetical protein